MLILSAFCFISLAFHSWAIFNRKPEYLYLLWRNCVCFGESYYFIYMMDFLFCSFWRHPQDVEMDLFEMSLLLRIALCFFLFCEYDCYGCIYCEEIVFVLKKLLILDIRWTCSVHFGDFLEMLKFLWFIVKDRILYI